MKINKLEKLLTKQVKKEYTHADGYARIDRVIIDHNADGNLITVIGAIGAINADGEVLFQYEFEVFFADGKSYNYVLGMIREHIYLTYEK